LDRIAKRRALSHAFNMHLAHGSQGRRRPADNELYDRGCDLVEAAMTIRRLSEDRNAARAVPALLGCIESALHELGCAISSLDEISSDAPVPHEVGQRMHRGFMNLGLAMADAELASTAARGLAERTVVAAAQSRPPQLNGPRSFDPRRDR
jgi:hypothetical protein